MAIKDQLIKLVEEKGWLAIESAYFDNSYLFKYASSRGRVCISKSMNALITMDIMDSFDSSMVNDKIVTQMNKYSVGHHKSITIQDLDSLQRFSLSLFMTTFKDYYPLPIPNIPVLDNITDFQQVVDAIPDTELGYMVRANADITARWYSTRAEIEAKYLEEEIKYEELRTELPREIILGTRIYPEDYFINPDYTLDPDSNPAINLDKARLWSANCREFTTFISTYLGVPTSDLI